MLPYIYGQLIQDMESTCKPIIVFVEKIPGKSITETWRDISVAALGGSYAQALDPAICDAAPVSGAALFRARR